MAGLTRTTQQQFGGGTYRNGALELIPPNGCFDISNGLLNLAGDVFRRGGSTYRSNAPFGSGLRWIWDGWLATSGHTTLIASTTEYGKLEGSGAVTALGHGGQSSPGKAVAYKGVLYLPGGQTYDGTTWGTAAKVAPYYAVVANRLLAASNDTVWFSHISTAGVPEPAKYEPNDFHTIPGGVQILGIEGGRDSCIVFTTGGVWVISNMAMNLVDATGNVQQRLDRFSGDLVLWGAQGIAAWQGNLIVPGTDAVWLINRGVSSEVPKSFTRIGDPIHSLYEEYVRSSYVPGGACVHESNYLLPVLGYGTVVDLLACRLDIPHPAGQGQGAWSRLAGSGAKVPALVSRVSDQTAREPELLGVEHEGNRRVLTLNYYLPTAVNHRDADGTVPPFSLETRGYATGQLDVNLVARLRIGYRCSDNEGEPTIRAEVAGGHPSTGGSVWGAFAWGGAAKWSTPGAGTYEPLAGEAPPSVTSPQLAGARWGSFTWGSAASWTSGLTIVGEAPVSIVGMQIHSWRLRRRAQTVRFRLTCSQPSAQLVLKQLEVFIRPGGRP